MERMRMETPDLTAANVEKIGALFPNCITETTDENGKLRKAINFDLLRQMLSADVVEGAAIRVEADGMSPIIRDAQEGEMLLILGQENSWYKVLLTGDFEFGYVYEKDVIFDVQEEKDPEKDLEAEEQKTELPKKVTIFTSRRVVMTVGEPVVLTSKLEGFEDCEEIYFQWKGDKGNGCEDVPGANEDSYVFDASAESLGWGWRLTVSYR